MQPSDMTASETVSLRTTIGVNITGGLFITGSSSAITPSCFTACFPLRSLGLYLPTLGAVAAVGSRPRLSQLFFCGLWSRRGCSLSSLSVSTYCWLSICLVSHPFGELDKPNLLSLPREGVLLRRGVKNLCISLLVPRLPSSGVRSSKEDSCLFVEL